MKFKVTLSKGRSKIVDLDAELTIDVLNLDKELMQQPQKFANMGTLWVLARHKYESLERRAGERKADLNRTFRERWPYKAVKPTEPAIANAILEDGEYRALRKAAEIAKKEMGLLAIAKEAMEQRRDSLVQLNKNNRTEYENS